METRIPTKNRKMVSSVVAFVFSLLIVVGSAADGEDKDAKIRFYRTIDDFEEIPLISLQNMFNSSWYNSTRSTIIFCHGFTGFPTGPAVLGVMRAYLEQGESNVALLNWEHLAANSLSTIPSSYINWAVPNARQLGVRLAAALGKLSGIVDFSRLYLIGHSLGAHVFGIAGNNLRLNGILLPWIVGLDPAALGFENKAPSMRLNPGSAKLVTVIHSDPSKYGSKQQLGTVDFWPNYKGIGHVRQPGCGDKPSSVFSPEDLCSHHRSWELFIDAIKHPGTIIGSHARNFKIWKRYSHAQRAATTMSIETYKKNAIPGNYYLVTNAQSPYGLGENGL
ncbi:phospholipase A1 VesT1.02-like [Pieris napi]|uniref:phospholipase A1 VesT1.02-like n=1 Tax=Pieris napi TaxID=78633 RepID=UPI001FBC06C1|nr:phospholipase A1 VesT1.02-like [Pieris napi]